MAVSDQVALLRRMVTARFMSLRNNTPIRDLGVDSALPLTRVADKDGPRLLSVKNIVYIREDIHAYVARFILSIVSEATRAFVHSRRLAVEYEGGLTAG